MTKEQAYETIERYKPLYDVFKRSGNVSLTYTQQVDLSTARKAINGNTTNLGCGNCLIEMMVEVFRELNNYNISKINQEIKQEIKEDVELYKEVTKRKPKAKK